VAAREGFKESYMTLSLFFLILALVLAVVASAVGSAGRVSLFPLAFASYVLAQIL
jgi:hypothetical protein